MCVCAVYVHISCCTVTVDQLMLLLLLLLYAAEREYDTSYFHNMVQRVLIDDHNVPRFT